MSLTEMSGLIKSIKRGIASDTIATSRANGLSLIIFPKRYTICSATIEDVYLSSSTNFGIAS